MIGVWEEGQFLGAVLFGTGAGNATNGRRFGLAQRFEVAELVRVALREHRTPVSRIVAIALRMVRTQSPGLRLIVSFADPYHGHVGGIYQAMGWLYAGTTGTTKVYIDGLGREHHERVVSPTGLKKHYGRYVPVMRPTDAVRVVRAPGKYIYVWPLDAETRALVQPLAKPYPKRAGSSDSAVPPIQGGEGGAKPTPALQLFPMRSLMRKVS